MIERVAVLNTLQMQSMSKVQTSANKKPLKNTAGKQVRNARHLQALALLGTVYVYLKPQFDLLFEKVA